MKKVLIVLVVLIAAVGAYFIFKKPAKATAASGGEGDDAAAPQARVETVPVRQERMVQTLLAFGVVGTTPSGERVIAAPYDCVVRQVNVAQGSTVAAGDVLLEIEPTRDARLTLDSARATLAAATKQRAAMQERFDLKLANQQELLTAQQAEQDAQLKVRSYDAAGLGGEGVIKADAAGVIDRVDANAGAVTTLGAALLRVASADQIEAQLSVEGTELSSVHVGESVELKTAGATDAASVHGTVRSVGRAIDPANGSIAVRVALPAGASLVFGQHVQAEIAVRENPSAIVLPREAVLPKDDKQVVFVVKNGKAALQEVQLGIAAQGLVEVTSPQLHPGDLVATTGAYELTDGMAVDTGANHPAEAKP